MFTVSKTYDVVTHESAEDGEAAESGFVFEDSRMTLRETLREIDGVGGGHWQETHNGLTLYVYDADVDYRTGDSTTYALHVAASPRNIARLTRFIQRCFN